MDGKLEEYERAWQAAGGTDITVGALDSLFQKLGQQLDPEQLSKLQTRLQSAGKISFPQFLELFRADLLDLQEILSYLQMGSTAPTGVASRPEVC